MMIAFLEGPCDLTCSAAVTAGQSWGTSGSWIDPGWCLSCHSYHSDLNIQVHPTMPQCLLLPGMSLGAPQDPPHWIDSQLL